MRTGDRVDVLATAAEAAAAEVVAGGALVLAAHGRPRDAAADPGGGLLLLAVDGATAARLAAAATDVHPHRDAARADDAAGGAGPGQATAARVGWMGSMLKGFKDFLLRGNVVDLAVAVVIGTAFTALVASFTASFLKPLIGLIGGGGVTGGDADGQRAAFTWGAFISAVITFVLTAAVVYFIVVLPMKAIVERRKRGEEAGPAAPTQVELLVEIRDLLRAQQGRGAGSRPVRAGHHGAARPAVGRASVAAPVRRPVLQVAAVVVGGVGGRSPQPTSLSSGARRAGARRGLGRRRPSAGSRLAEPLEHLRAGQRGEHGAGDRELAAAGPRADDHAAPRRRRRRRRAPASRPAARPA